MNSWPRRMEASPGVSEAPAGEQKCSCLQAALIDEGKGGNFPLDVGRLQMEEETIQISLKGELRGSVVDEGLEC